MPASPRVIGKNSRLYLGDLAFYLRMFELEFNTDLAIEDSSVFGSDWKEFEVIDAQGSQSINAFLDTERPGVTPPENYISDAAFYESFAVTGSGAFKADLTIPISLILTNAAARGDPVRFFKSIMGNVAVQTPRAGIGQLRGSFKSTDEVKRGIVLSLVEQSFPTGDTFIPTTLGTDLGAAGTTGIIAAYHVYKKTAGAVFTIEVQDSTTSGGAYAATLVFPTFTARGSAWKKETDAAGKQFQRVRVNNAGAAETLGIVVVSGNI